MLEKQNLFSSKETHSMMWSALGAERGAGLWGEHSGLMRPVPSSTAVCGCWGHHDPWGCAASACRVQVLPGGHLVAHLSPQLGGKRCAQCRYPSRGNHSEHQSAVLPNGEQRCTLVLQKKSTSLGDSIKSEWFLGLASCA